ncbi:protein E9 [Proboscivirus elephantidbeta4]|uniref:Protein E9 n=1 Tax=Elephant endotheliotropic herpesvirus 4 TaxID=548914 RepID=A0A0S1TKI5_9BETA|nr:protein E9 [Elephant endotheliotropic herpesvirus 4]ALM25939.1 protein E9 [Elephant endotheliotropic herpesvirus 4]
MDDEKVERLFGYYVKNYNYSQGIMIAHRIEVMLRKMGVDLHEQYMFERYTGGYTRFYVKYDGYITLVLILVFIIFLLLCVFQYAACDNVIKRYKAYYDIILNCISTYILLLNFKDFKFLFDKNLIVAKNVLNSDISYMFFYIYKCVYLIMWLCFVYCIIVLNFYVKNNSLKQRYICFIKKLNRRMLIYLLYMLLRVDYSSLSGPPSNKPCTLLENVVVFLLYYIVFFLLSETCDAYLVISKKFSWKILVLIGMCMYVYDKHVYYNNIEEPYIFKKYFSVDFNMYSFLVYLFTKQLLLF